MEVAQVVGFGVIATVFIIFIRQNRPDIAQLLSIGVGVIIVVYVLGYLKMIVDVITDLALEAEINTIFLRTLLRVIGVAYLAEFGAQVCRDAGEGSIAGKIEFAGKLIILVMAIPVLLAVLESIISFVP
ncbi:MAG: stage III sporulation protein AD [Bacillota bacterium]|jgi:stage III sporulation protein AD|nr:stage III sporulation protein AD [Bacillota bacterium]